MKTKIVNGIEVKVRTDEEALQFVCDEFERAKSLPHDKSVKVRKRAKLVFDKRFPNPDVCPTCRRKAV